MRFTDWFLKQLCDHRDDNTGFSTFMMWHIDSKRIIRCTRCALQFDVSEVVWERWLREKK
jgi:hypothetical protein